MGSRHHIRLNVNGTDLTAEVEARRLLADFLREDLELRGTHLGCEHGICGACTVLLDGEPVRSCLMFAVQAHGARITTVEGLARGEALHPLQRAFWEHHALQCGFCTPGILLTVVHLLGERPGLTDEREIREALAGNLCRCTGYQNIVDAVRDAASRLPGAAPAAEGHYFGHGGSPQSSDSTTSPEGG
ncbi:MAG: (2Fe-2S)-binding protein [Armatimonadota bacterium]|nr:(2Fe-2S)-binding protein [Armatimonadota bacterium]MDR7548630.1 (2Fe-2S)-binding protein [Armatimonadota bacterium]